MKNKTWGLVELLLLLLIEKVIIAISSPPLLVVRSLLLSIPLALTLCAAILVGRVAILGTSPLSFGFGGIGGFSQTEIGFSPWCFLGSPKNIGD